MNKEEKAVGKFGIAIGMFGTMLAAPFVVTVVLGVIAAGLAVSGLVDLNKKN